MSIENNHSMTAPEIADALGITARTVRLWAEAGDLPRLERGRFDIGWATWLAVGRKATSNWHPKASACVAVATGWLQAQDGAPLTDASAGTLGDLFKRNGLSLTEAMRSIGAAQARMERA